MIIYAIMVILHAYKLDRQPAMVRDHYWVLEIEPLIR